MLRAVSLVALAAGGCAAADEPRLIAIEPARVSTLDVTPAVVTGANLRAALHLDLDSHDPATVDAGWTVLIADAAMPDTQWRDRTSLDVTLPSGLPIGTHDVRAVAPDGTALVLEAALVVVAGDELAPDAMLDSPRDADVPQDASDAALDAGPDAPPDAAPDAPPDAPAWPLVPTVVAVDPFGDGSGFAYVTSYLGRVVVGPNRTGERIAQVLPDGSGLSSRTFHFERDVTGNTHQNPAAPYASVGAPGCIEDTAACGPNNENELGILAGFTINNTEWLVIFGGSTAKGLEHVYMSSDTDDMFDFRYVDIKASIAGEAYTGTALAVKDDRLYLGSLGEASATASLIALTITPPLPGTDATSTQAIGMKLNQSPIGSGGMMEKLDALGVFGDRVYAANPRGWLRAADSTPRPYGLSDALWTWNTVTPTAGEYSAATSVTTTKLGSLTPSDRAVPQLAEFAGRFYIARNTTTGPQLWMCTPAVLTPTDCNSADWSLVGSTGTHTQLGSTLPPAISMVAATAAHLYVGFDSSTGVEVYRTSATGGSFELVGTPGLGVAGATQIMDGKRLVFPGDDHVWLTIGSPSTPVTLVKLP